MRSPPLEGRSMTSRKRDKSFRVGRRLCPGPMSALSADIRRTPDKLKIPKVPRGCVHPACRAAKRLIYYGPARNHLNPRCRYRMLGPVAAPGLRGEIQMPTKVNLELIIVWFCVGFFTGAGWAVATWLVGRILGLTHL